MNGAEQCQFQRRRRRKASTQRDQVCAFFPSVHHTRIYAYTAEVMTRGGSVGAGHRVSRRGAQGQ